MSVKTVEEADVAVATERSPAQDAVDFNLHNFVGIRLVDAHPADVAAVSRQLGPIRGPLQGRPDIVIRFVDRIEAPALRYADMRRVAFSDEHFFVLRSKHKTPARVRIPLDRVGERCEIVCERGLPAIPLLIPIINVTALANGALPLHAAGFIHEGKGTLVTGWSKGGKTEALLGFMARGATYVADEWNYLYDRGRKMAGIPEPIRIWDWHLEAMPDYRRRLRKGERLRLAATGALVRTMERLTSAANGSSAFPVRFLRRIKPLVKKQHGVNVAPQRLFDWPRCAKTASLDRVFFVVSSESPEIEVARVDPLEIAERMVFSLQEEQRRFLSYYRQFRFAFPDSANHWIEASQQIQRARLRQMLAGKETYAVYHPYPVPIEEMVTAMEGAIN